MMTQMQVKRKTNCSAWDWHGRVGGGKLVVGPTRKLIGVEHIRPPSLKARGAMYYFTHTYGPNFPEIFYNAALLKANICTDIQYLHRF